jgi:hypothetical protein
VHWLLPDAQKHRALLPEVIRQRLLARAAEAGLKPMPVATEKKEAEAPEAEALDSKSMVQFAPELSNGCL